MHTGPKPIDNTAAWWRLQNTVGMVVAGGELATRTVPVDRGVPMGQVTVNLSSLPAPAAYRLSVGLKNTGFENDWRVWLYPAKVGTNAPENVLAVSNLDEQLISRLEHGERVLLLQS
jgi:hypothetical protein